MRPPPRNELMPAKPSPIKHRTDEPWRNPRPANLARVDENQLAVVLSLDLDLALAGDRDPVARVSRDAVDGHAAAGDQIQMAVGLRLDRNRFAGLHGRAEDPGVGVD